MLAHQHESPLPIYRKPWNEDHLIGTAAIGDMIADARERKWFKELHARCATECAKGWFVDWELVAVVGRKKDLVEQLIDAVVSESS